MSTLCIFFCVKISLLNNSTLSPRQLQYRFLQEFKYTKLLINLLIAKCLVCQLIGILTYCVDGQPISDMSELQGLSADRLYD